MLCTKTLIEQEKKFTEIKKIAKRLDDNSAISKNGDNSVETVEWLWKKATKGNYLDLRTIEIEPIDIKRFDREVKGFIKNYQKEPSFFSRYFKLPKALLRNIPQAEKFYNRMAEAMSFNERQTKESSQHISSMVDGMYKMLETSGGSKKAFKEFQQLERNLLAAKTPEQKQAMILQLNKYLTENNGGNVVQRFQKLLTMEELPTTPNEKMIVKEWEILRANSMNNLLNGAIMTKMAIKELNKGASADYLNRAIDKIQEQIDSLLIQSEVDNKLLETGAYSKVDLKVYNPKTKQYSPYSKFNEGTSKREIYIENKKYVPSYVMELMEVISNISEYGLNKDKSKFGNKSASEIYAEVESAVVSELNSNRLKHKGITEKYASLDPIYYLNKYSHDVATFNTRARIQYAYVKGTENLLKQLRRNNSQKGGDTGDYARNMIDMLTEIKDSAINNHKGQMDSMDHLVQIINGFEYVSKLGFSVRGALKNRTQALFNWVFYGKKGYDRSREFYDRSSREYETGTAKDEFRTNAEIFERQMKRFGLKMGDKFKTSAAATGGSLDILYVPEGFTLDRQGKIIPETKKTGLKRAALISEKATDIASSTMAWAENKNRIGTFKIAFANAFMVENNRYDYHAKALKEKSGREPSKNDIYNAIERAAGNAANDMVRTLHFDYDTWAKAKVLQSPAGKVIGQYQHFKFAFFDMQYKLINEFAKDVKDFNIKERDPITGNMVMSESFSRMFRLASIYTLLPGLAGLAFNSDLGGVFGAFGSPFEEDRAKEGSQTGGVSIIENPLIEDAGKLYQFITADDKKEKYASYYGKNPITAQLGPFVSDLLTAAELLDFWNQTDPEYEAHRSLNFDPTNEKWWYNVARIFNIQGARTGWHTMPALLKGQMEKAIRVETGIFQPRWMKNWRKDVMESAAGATYNRTNILPDVKFNKKKKSNAAALAALRGL